MVSTYVMGRNGLRISQLDKVGKNPPTWPIYAYPNSKYGVCIKARESISTEGILV